MTPAHGAACGCRANLFTAGTSASHATAKLMTAATGRYGMAKYKAADECSGNFIRRAEGCFAVQSSSQWNSVSRLATGW